MYNYNNYVWNETVCLCFAVSIRMIVGAPNGTAASGAVDNVGVVYRCPVARGSCEPLLGDGSGPDRRLYDTDGELKK